MDNDKLEIIVENEREWRKHIYNRLEAIENKQDKLSDTATTLKVKVGLISTIFGAIGAGVLKWASVFLGSK